MYLYIVDIVAIKKESKLMSDIKHYTKLGGIDGDFIYLSPIHNTKNDIFSRIATGKQYNVIVIGNTISLNKVINIIYEDKNINNEKIRLGLIPVEVDIFSKLMGLSKDVKKNINTIIDCKSELIDICSINNNYFLDNLSILFNSGFTLEVDSSYFIKSTDKASVVVSNFIYDPKTKKITNIKDGFFDILIYSKDILSGSFKATTSNIYSEEKNIRFIINNKQYKTDYIKISIIKNGLNLIINRNSIITC